MWSLKLIKPEVDIESALRGAWFRALDDLKDWMSTTLVRAMTFGGLGIEGIANTPFYNFISSPEGLSELGIDKGQPPLLLRAYETSAFKVVKTGNSLNLMFGDVAQLKMSTPHPAAGTGFLHVESWLEFIVDDVGAHRGFVPRNALPKSVRKAIRLKAPLGGLMLPENIFGSTGSWEFPEKFRDYDVQWLQANSKNIESAILKQVQIFLQKRLR